MESTPGETFLIVGTKLDLSEKFLDYSVTIGICVCLFVLDTKNRSLNEYPSLHLASP